MLLLPYDDHETDFRVTYCHFVTSFSFWVESARYFNEAPQPVVDHQESDNCFGQHEQCFRLHSLYLRCNLQLRAFEPEQDLQDYE